MMSRDNKEPLSATEARQGVRGTHLFALLIAALVLAGIVWIGVEIWGRHIDPDKSQTNSSSMSTTTGNQPQGGTIDNTPPAGQPSQSAPTDRTDNNQQGINSTPQQPSRNGTQN